MNILNAGTRAYRIAPDVSALMRPYVPFLRRSDAIGPSVSSYYIESNALYHEAKRVARESGGSVLSGDDVPVRGLLQSAEVACIGRNSLAATRDFGSCFCVQLVKNCGEFEFESNDGPSECVNCGACERACPGHAITESGVTDEKCIRFHMDGTFMPEFVTKGITRLFGCDICQLVCKRNAHIRPVPMSAELKSLFTYENIFSGSRKKEMAALVGKNMLTRGRLEAASLILAKRDNWPNLADAAQRLKHDVRPAVVSALCHLGFADYSRQSLNVIKTN